MTGSNAGNSLGNMVKDSAKVVGGLGDALRGNINSFADSAVDQTPKAQHNAATAGAGGTSSSSSYTTGSTSGTTGLTGKNTVAGGGGGVGSRSAETGDRTAARGADAFKQGMDGLRSHGRT